MRHALLLLASILTLAGCSRGMVGTVVTVTNESAGAISNAVVWGTGFSNHLGVIAAGDASSVTFRPSADSGVTLAFDVAGKRMNSGSREHVATAVDYSVGFIIKPDLSVFSGSGIRHAVDK
jgi:hypothetical protein